MSCGSPSPGKGGLPWAPLSWHSCWLGLLWVLQVPFGAVSTLAAGVGVVIAVPGLVVQSSQPGPQHSLHREGAEGVTGVTLVPQGQRS